MEFCAHIAGVEQFHESLFIAGEGVGVLAEDRLDDRLGMVHKKAFLALQVDVMEAVVGHDAFHFLPDEVVRNVVITWVGQQVGANAVVAVSAAGAVGALVKNGGAIQAVVTGDECAGPRLAEQLPEQGVGAAGPINEVTGWQSGRQLRNDIGEVGIMCGGVEVPA